MFFARSYRLPGAIPAVAGDIAEDDGFVSYGVAQPPSNAANMNVVLETLVIVSDPLRCAED